MDVRSGCRRLAVLLGAVTLVPCVEPVPAGGQGRGPYPSAAGVEIPRELRLLVHTGRRMLYGIADGRDTVFAAPVATGMDRDFTYGSRTYRFETPRGRRTVLGKSPDPVWTVPEWHYYEKAVRLGLEPVHLRPGEPFLLSDGTRLVMREGRPGRINHAGFFAALPIGVEIIFDGRIFIPPLDSMHRRVPGALGPFKLDLGEGYLIHGTNRYTEDSIGHAVSHGCIRMSNDDLARLYEIVPVGTPVDIV